MKRTRKSAGKEPMSMVDARQPLCSSSKRKKAKEAKPVFVAHPTRTEKISHFEVELRTKDYLSLLRAFTAQEFDGRIETSQLVQMLEDLSKLEDGLLVMVRRTAERKAT